MIDYCLEERRSFGVLLIREGAEVGGEAIPHPVGTTATIVGVNRLEGGRMNLVTIGDERFHLRAIRRDRPYLVGVAEPWPLTDGNLGPRREQIDPIGALFRLYLTLLAQAQGDKVDIEEMPADARALALLVAITLRVPMVEKQRLLAQPTIAHMLGRERTLLRREQLLLDYVIRTQSEQWEGGASGTLAQN
jgi:Lon protease-like protein